MSVSIKNATEIAAMRQGGQILAKVLREVAAAVKPGVTTAELDTVAAQAVAAAGAEAAFKGYQGFPFTICISINDEVVHGLPSRTRVLAEGDIVGLDFGVTFKGMITDGTVTVPVGAVDADAERLLSTTNQALSAGIAQATAGNRVGDISAAIEKVLRQGRLGVIEELIGHGVGHSLHEDPVIPNLGRAGTGPVLKAGMTLAIEPMATLGSPRVRLADDGWTYATVDGSLAAQFEHTVLITDGPAEILTA
ncbi:MAG TPA: type I methionyl aminopeptidase [Candidatus Saccharimonadales bacterium]|nr:type I methionyl aminopeptidase [Candidatus Saccharimonadales bacterium]